jgi:hypothetical protein
MLGRLRMSVDECILAYIQLSSKVFQKKHASPIKISGKVRARYSRKELQRAIEEIVLANNLDKDSLLKDTSPRVCKVFVPSTDDIRHDMRLTGRRFVCATSKGVPLPYILRSYPPTREGPELYHCTKI